MGSKLRLLMGYKLRMPQEVQYSIMNTNSRLNHFYLKLNFKNILIVCHQASFFTFLCLNLISHSLSEMKTLPNS